MTSESKTNVLNPGYLFTEICKKQGNDSLYTYTACFSFLELFTIVCRAPRFKGFRQQDSQELLRYLLDSVREEEIKVRQSSNGSIRDDSLDLQRNCLIELIELLSSISTVGLVLVQVFSCSNTGSIRDYPYSLLHLRTDSLIEVSGILFLGRQARNLAFI